MEPNRTIREVIIINCSNEYYTVKFAKGIVGFASEKIEFFPLKEAEESIMKAKTFPKPPQAQRYPSPWDD